jgi:hypothetical protein
MEKHVETLLSVLRQAINDAVLGSHDVNAALRALSRAGICPSFWVDVSLEGEEVQQSSEPGELVLQAADEEFLQSLGIAMEAKVAQVSGRLTN